LRLLRDELRLLRNNNQRIRLNQDRLLWSLRHLRHEDRSLGLRLDVDWGLRLRLVDVDWGLRLRPRLDVDLRRSIHRGLRRSFRRWGRHPAASERRRKKERQEEEDGEHLRWSSPVSPVRVHLDRLTFTGKDLDGSKTNRWNGKLKDFLLED
jgi:hypothetical protein